MSVTPNYDGMIIEWDVDSRKILHKYIGHEGCVNSAVYSPDGQKILSASNDKTMKEWNSNTGELLRTYDGSEGHTDWVNNAIYSNDGSKILSCSDDKSIKEWAVDSGRCIRTFRSCPFIIRSAINSHKDHRILDIGGNRVLFVYNNDTVMAYDIDTNKNVSYYKNQSARLINTESSCCGKRVLSFSKDNIIKEYDIKTGECIHIYEGHCDEVVSAVYDNNGKYILSLSKDMTIKEWEINTEKCLYTYLIKSLDYSGINNGHSNIVKSAVYSPDGNKVLSASLDKTVREWDLNTNERINECIAVYDEHSDWVNSAIYNANGNVVLSASNDGTVKKWNIKNQNSIKTSKKCGSWLNCAIYKSDENHVLFVSGDGIITEWNLLTNKYRKIYENIPGLIINGCTFRNLHPRSELSDELKEVLKIYGAIFD